MSTTPCPQSSGTPSRSPAVTRCHIFPCEKPQVPPLAPSASKILPFLEAKGRDTFRGVLLVRVARDTPMCHSYPEDHPVRDTPCATHIQRPTFCVWRHTLRQRPAFCIVLQVEFFTSKAKVEGGRRHTASGALRESKAPLAGQYRHPPLMQPKGLASGHQRHRPPGASAFSFASRDTLGACMI